MKRSAREEARNALKQAGKLKKRAKLDPDQVRRGGGKECAHALLLVLGLAS